MAGNSLDILMELPVKKPGLDLSKPEQPEQSAEIETPDQAYKAWSKNRTPEHGAKLLKALNPYVSAATNRHAGSSSPIVLSKARSLLIDALPRYDGRSSLNTFVDRQLMPLKRWAPKQRTGVSISRSIVQQQARLQRAESELADKLDRAPSRAELADATGLSLQDIAKASNSYIPQAGEKMMEAEGQASASEDQAVERDSQLPVKMLYYSMSPVNQYIMEHTLGLHGASVLSNTQMAKHLKISSSAISQRKAQIQKMYDQASK